MVLIREKIFIYTIYIKINEYEERRFFKLALILFVFPFRKIERKTISLSLNFLRN